MTENKNKSKRQVKEVPLDELRRHYLGNTRPSKSLCEYEEVEDEPNVEEASSKVGNNSSSNDYKYTTSNDYSYGSSEEYIDSVDFPDEIIVDQGKVVSESKSESESESKSESKPEPEKKEPEDIPLDVLRSKYLKKSRNSTYKKQRTGLRLAKDIVLLITVIVMSLLMVISFATPTTKIGGETHNEKSKTIIGFLWRDSDSIWNQIKDSTETVKSLGDVDTLEDMDSEEDATALAGGILADAITLIRMLVIGSATLSVAISILVYLIKAIYHFAKANSAKLGNTLAGFLSQSIVIYIIFAYFGGISGGSGDSAYFVGYSVGWGMTAAMILGLIVLMFAVIATYVLNKDKAKAKKKSKDSFDKWITALCVGVCCILIAIVLTTVNMYSVISFILSSSLSGIILSIVNGFDIGAIIFPLFNFVLLVAAITIFGRTRAGFLGAFKYLMFYGDKEGKKTLNSRDVNLLPKKYAVSFIPTIVFAIISVIFVFCLNIPSIGYGWSVDIYNQFVLIFAFAALGQTAIFAFPNKKGDKKNKESEINKEDKTAKVEEEEAN